MAIRTIVEGALGWPPQSDVERFMTCIPYGQFSSRGGELSVTDHSPASTVYIATLSTTSVGSGVIEYGDGPRGSSTRTLLDRATGQALSILRSNVERSDQSERAFSMVLKVLRADRGKVMRIACFS